jgi:hypothetical protein
MNPPVMAGWNLGLRFALELAALAGLGTAAWRLTTGFWQWVAALAVPVVAAAVWTIFNVPNDPSRSGRAPVEVSGGLRLALELAVLAAGSAGFLLRGPIAVGIVMAVLAVAHYAASMPRIRWLLDQ